MSNHANSRREFLHTTLAGAAVLGLAPNVMGTDEGRAKGLPTRPLGKTGERVSVLCLGGWHIGAVQSKLSRVFNSRKAASLTRRFKSRSERMASSSCNTNSRNALQPLCGPALWPLSTRRGPSAVNPRFINRRDPRRSQ